MNVIQSEESKKLYLNNIFKDTGVDTLTTYTQELTKIWYTNETYPTKLGMVFGIPFFEYAHSIKNKDELLGRIKILAQILGISVIQINIRGTIIDINLDGEK